MKALIKRSLAVVIAAALLATALIFTGCDDHPDAVKSDSLLNTSFENELENWILTGDCTPGATYVARESRTGKYALSCWALDAYTSEVYQKIKGIEPGYYTLVAYTQSSGGQDSAYLYACGSDQGKCMTSIPATGELNAEEDGWVKVTVRGVEVGSDGILTVGFHSDAKKTQWVNIDDIELIAEENAPKPFLIGGDVSQLTYVEDCGAKFYYADGTEGDALQILAEGGWNFARLRVYNDPGKGRGDGDYYCHEDYMNPEDILSLAKRVKDKGMAIELTLHYSDYWSNAETQNIPFAWQEEIKGMSDKEAVDRLTELIYEFTKDYMVKLKDQGTIPEYVSLGNETTAGMLFPYGRCSASCWPNLGRFFAAGYDAIKEVSPETQVIIHLDDCGDMEQYTYFFDSCIEAGGKFDIIGSSYYPFWTKRSVTEMKNFCNAMKDRYECEVMLMETGYNFNSTLPDGWGGQLSDNGCYDGVYESTPEGQRDFMIDLFNAMKNTEGGNCIGDIYWDPIFVNQNGVGWAYFEEWDVADKNVVSNTTQFDFEHIALPVLDAYKYNSNGRDYALLAGKLVGDDDGATPISDTAITVKVGSDKYNTVTDACGGFILHIPEADNDKLTVTADGLDMSGDAQKITAKKGETVKATIQMNGGTISGAVIDDRGNAVPNAQITVSGDSYGMALITDEKGAYTASDLPEGKYTVSAQTNGYVISTEPFEVSVEIGEASKDNNVAATLISGTVSGRVVDASGAPLSGVTVTAWLDIKDGDENTDYGRIVAYTDEEGCYTLPFVTAGTPYLVQAYLYTYDDVTVGATIDIGESFVLDDFALLQALGGMSGKVVDNGGKIVSGALVELTSTDGLTYSGMTGGDGSFSIDNVLVGTYTVRASKSGMMSGSVSGVTVEIGEKANAGSILMPKPVEIKNPGFEEQGESEDKPAGWTIECSSNSTNGNACIRQNRTTFGGALEGVYGLGIWLDSDFTANAYQTVKGLTPGKYVLGAQIYSGIGGGTFVMYVKDTDGNIIAQTDIAESSSYVSVALEFQADGSDIVIGFMADTVGADWAVVDLVELGRC